MKLGPIENFVPLDGWAAEVERPAAPNELEHIEIAVAGLGRRTVGEWFICAITDDGVLEPVSAWGKVTAVHAPDDDDEEGTDPRE